MDGLLTTQELADKLCVRPCTIRDWARAGKIPEIKISPKVRRFDYAEVLDSLRKRNGGQGVATA